MNLHDIYLAAQLAKNDNSGTEVDLSEYYTKSQIDSLIAGKVAEIVADAPEDFNTLKETSDWIANHEDSVAAMNTAIATNTAAIADKVDKVPGKGLSTNDFTNEAKNKLDSLENYDDTEIKADIAEVSSRAALNQSTLGYQRKNLLKLFATTQTKAGVTYTVNDGLINASGTTTGNSTYVMFDAKVPQIFDRDVIATYTGEMTNTICRLRLGEAGSYSYPAIYKSGYRIPAGTKFSQVYLQQPNADVTVNISDFGVMLRYAEITDDTYEPYRPSVAEYIAGLEERIAALESVNLITNSPNSSLNTAKINTTEEEIL